VKASTSRAGRNACARWEAGAGGWRNGERWQHRKGAGASFSVKFYLTAILFIVFDVEVVFLYPWALLFRRLGMFGFVEMMIFISVLALGLVYIWRKGALEWD
jgi:NADH:ubiquinone oxidoreductase subunit 3 (subunit A)